MPISSGMSWSNPKQLLSWRTRSSKSTIKASSIEKGPMVDYAWWVSLHHTSTSVSDREAWPGKCWSSTSWPRVWMDSMTSVSIYISLSMGPRRCVSASTFPRMNASAPFKWICSWDMRLTMRFRRQWETKTKEPSLSLSVCVLSTISWGIRGVVPTILWSFWAWLNLDLRSESGCLWACLTYSGWL